jgi:hypothetical protein
LCSRNLLSFTSETPEVPPVTVLIVAPLPLPTNVEEWIVVIAVLADEAEVEALPPP